MGVEIITAWIIVRRYDNSESEVTSNSPPIPLALRHSSNYMEIKSQIRKWLGLSENNNEVIKLRKSDGTLVTLTSLLEGNSSEEPYMLDIALIHQNTPASPRFAFSPTYIDTVRSKLYNLEKRVERVESLIPEVRSRRLATIERAMQQLGAKVNFLDKRLDELAPLDWKAQFQLSPSC